MAPPGVEQSFQSFLDSDRKKKQHEALASQMLGKGRRTGTPTGTRSALGPGASLASRMGVNKRSSSTANINGQWSHDLHDARGGRARPSTMRTQSASNLERENRLQTSIKRGGMQQFNIASNHSRASDGQLSIRGMASGGPYIVMASNFAPGTTAADIESAMAPVGLTLEGEQCLQRCRVLSSSPTVLAELEFTDRHGAENVIATFNNQKADGRVLYVYLKQGGPTPTRVDRSSKPAEKAAGLTAKAQPRTEDPSDLTDDIMIVDTVGDARNAPQRSGPRNGAGRLEPRNGGQDGTYHDGRYGYDESGEAYERQSHASRGRSDYAQSRNHADERRYGSRGYSGGGRGRY